MTLKINVMYKGIIYRVRGIKVLCSVVAAVILLLIAIVALGIWMLISVYGEEKAIPNHFVNSSVTKDEWDGEPPRILKQSSSVDFFATDQISSSNTQPFTPPTKIYASFSPSATFGRPLLRSQQSNNTDINEMISLDSRIPLRSIAPVPPITLFGGLHVLDDPLKMDNIKKQTYDSFGSPSINNRPHVLPPPDHGSEDWVAIIPHNRRMGITGEFPLDKEFNKQLEKVMQLPPHLIPKNINTAVVIEDELLLKGGQRGPSAPVAINSNQKEQQAVLIPSEQTVTYSSFPLFNKREKLERAENREEEKSNTGIGQVVEFTEKPLVYSGPPVVGYGSDPYKKLSQDKLQQYEEFWSQYKINKTSPDYHDDRGPVPEDRPYKFINHPRPRVRGPLPNGEGYNLPRRPDAQLPPIRPRPGGRPPSLRRYRPGNRILPPPPGYPHPKLKPPMINPNRLLHVGSDVPLQDITQSSPASTISTTAISKMPILGPFQDMYDYSRRLAALLLNFATKPSSELRNATDDIVEHGVTMMEDYNKIFHVSNNSPLTKLTSLIPTSERLRSLDPVELSLVTWTFLDFWEFLIEKVGSLSKEDLDLLRARLERLRRRKDNSLTKSFVNETLSHLTIEKQKQVTNGTVFSIAGLKSALMGRDSNKEPKKMTKRSAEKSVGKTIEIINEEKITEETEKNPRSKSIDVTALLEESYKQNLKLLSNETNSNSKNTEVQIKNHIINNHNQTQTEKQLKDPTFIVKENVRYEVENLQQTPEAQVLKIQFAQKSDPKERSLTLQEPNSNQPENKKINNIDMKNQSSKLYSKDISEVTGSEVIEGRMWSPLEMFNSEARIQFMQFAIKVLFNFGKVYLKKSYALDCTLLLFCKDLNQATKKEGMDGMAAKIKSVGLKVLTEKELREQDTFGEIWRAITAWQPLQCKAMFPKCDGSKALEIVNEVALGSN